jgi:diguanylate cyclase (GGDEF)-like protein
VRAHLEVAAVKGLQRGEEEAQRVPRSPVAVEPVLAELHVEPLDAAANVGVDEVAGDLQAASKVAFPRPPRRTESMIPDVRPRLRLPLAYALVGAALAMGAPLGWLALRLVGGAVGSLPGSVWGEVMGHPRIYAYLACSTIVAFAAFGAALGRVVEQRDAANARLSVLAVTDALTGLRNVRYFHERLAQEWARTRRQTLPLALIVGDIDCFKEVNDRFGHADGDHALAHVASLIAANVRASDVPCRIGGEEFGIICPDSTASAAAAVAERVRAALAASPVVTSNGTKVEVTASFGVAAAGASTDDLFRTADAALYAAKAAGRNRVTPAADV